MDRRLKRSFGFNEEERERLFFIEDKVQEALEKHIELSEIIRCLIYWFDIDEVESFAKFCELRRYRKNYEGDFVDFLGGLDQDRLKKLINYSKKKEIPFYEAWAKTISIASS